MVRPKPLSAFSRVAHTESSQIALAAVKARVEKASDKEKLHDEKHTCLEITGNGADLNGGWYLPLGTSPDMFAKAAYP